MSKSINEIRINEQLRTSTNEERAFILNFLLSRKREKLLSILPDLIVTSNSLDQEGKSFILYFSYDVTTSSYTYTKLEVPESLKFYRISDMLLIGVNPENTYFVYDLGKLKFNEVVLSEKLKSYQLVNQIQGYKDKFFAKVEKSDKFQLVTLDVDKNGKFKNVTPVKFKLQQEFKDIEFVYQFNELWLIILHHEAYLKFYYRKQVDLPYEFKKELSSEFKPNQISKNEVLIFITSPHYPIQIVKLLENGEIITSESLEISQYVLQQVVQLSTSTYLITFTNRRSLIKTFKYTRQGTLKIKEKRSFTPNLWAFPADIIPIGSGDYIVLQNEQLEVMKFKYDPDMKQAFPKLDSVFGAAGINEHSHLYSLGVGGESKKKVVSLLVPLTKLPKELISATVDFF